MGDVTVRALGPMMTCQPAFAPSKRCTRQTDTRCGGRRIRRSGSVRAGLHPGGWPRTEPPSRSVVTSVVVRGADDPVVASLAGMTTDRLASVSRLFVSPAVRGCGLARALLGKASSWASALDLQLMLDVVEDGGHAVALYERLDGVWWIAGRLIASLLRANACPCGSTSPRRTRRCRCSRGPLPSCSPETSQQRIGQRAASAGRGSLRRTAYSRPSR